MTIRGSLILALAVSALPLAGCGSGPSTSVHILAVNQDVGRAEFSFSCNPPRGDIPSVAKACAAVMASPRLLTDPEPFTCRGGPFPSWDLTITGRLRGKPLFDFVSTCWTPQMGLIGTLGLAPILHAHLLARRRGRLTGGESRTFTDLRPGDLVSCVFADNELDLGVPTDTDGGRSSVGFTGGVVGINAVTLKIAVKGDRVVASCS